MSYILIDKLYNSNKKFIANFENLLMPKISCTKSDSWYIEPYRSAVFPYSYNNKAYIGVAGGFNHISHTIKLLRQSMQDWSEVPELAVVQGLPLLLKYRWENITGYK